MSTAPAPFTLHRITEADWAEVRALRLEMLADTPHAYLETLAHAEAHGEAEWRMRAARNDVAGAIGLAAVAPAAGEAGHGAAGRWVGTMAAYLPQDAPGAMLVGVYVAPAWRGAAQGTAARGAAGGAQGVAPGGAQGPSVADALLSGIEEWAGRHADVLRLQVHQDSVPARRFYKRRGFEETGRVLPYPLNPSQLELEMVKHLRPRATAGSRLLG